MRVARTNIERRSVRGKHVRRWGAIVCHGLRSGRSRRNLRSSTHAGRPEPRLSHKQWLRSGHIERRSVWVRAPGVRRGRNDRRCVAERGCVVLHSSVSRGRRMRPIRVGRLQCVVLQRLCGCGHMHMREPPGVLPAANMQRDRGGPGKLQPMIGLRAILCAALCAACSHGSHPTATAAPDCGADAVPTGSACDASTQCGCGAYCNAACGAVGTCHVGPVVCAGGSCQVCSCEGHTFESQCEAELAGASVAHSGACHASGTVACDDSSVCPDGGLCVLDPTATCEGGTSCAGICFPRENCGGECVRARGPGCAAFGGTDDGGFCIAGIGDPASLCAGASDCPAGQYCLDALDCGDGGAAAQRFCMVPSGAGP
jgi:hypothetical protein